MSLLTGMIFALGMVAIFYTIQDWRAFSFEPNSEWIPSPDDVAILSHSLVPDTQYLAIQGVVANHGSKKWRDISINATIKAGDMEIKSCSARVSDLEIDASRPFLIECMGLQGSGHPSNLTYEISVSDGYSYIRCCDEGDT